MRDPDLIAALVSAIPAFVATGFAADVRPQLAGPGVREFRGEPWTFASNGMVLLAIRGEHLPPGTATHPAFPDCAKVIPPDPEGELPALELRALKDFLGVEPPAAPACARCAGERFVECPECEGEGTEDCECDCGHEHTTKCSRCYGDEAIGCPDCNVDAAGSRERFPRIDPFAMGVAYFDKRAMRPILRALPDATVRVAQAGSERATTLLGDGWLVLLMPVRYDESEPRPPAPRFEIPAAGVAA